MAGSYLRCPGCREGSQARVPTASTDPHGGSRSRRRSGSEVPSASDGGSPREWGTAHQPSRRAEAAHPGHRSGQSTPDLGPGPGPYLSRHFRHFRQSLRTPNPPATPPAKDHGKSGLCGNPGTPGLPRSSAEAGSSTQTGRSGRFARPDPRQGVHPASPYPAAAASPERSRWIRTQPWMRCIPLPQMPVTSGAGRAAAGSSARGRRRR